MLPFAYTGQQVIVCRKSSSAASAMKIEIFAFSKFYAKNLCTSFDKKGLFEIHVLQRRRRGSVLKRQLSEQTTTNFSKVFIKAKEAFDEYRTLVDAAIHSALEIGHNTNQTEGQNANKTNTTKYFFNYSFAGIDRCCFLYDLNWPFLDKKGKRNPFWPLIAFGNYLADVLDEPFFVVSRAAAFLIAVTVLACLFLDD